MPDIHNQNVLANFHHLGLVFIRHLENVQEKKQLENVDDIGHPAGMVIWSRQPELEARNITTKADNSQLRKLLLVSPCPGILGKFFQCPAQH